MRNKTAKNLRAQARQLTDENIENFPIPVPTKDNMGRIKNFKLEYPEGSYRKEYSKLKKSYKRGNVND